jgi:cardiolipin synthase
MLRKTLSASLLSSLFLLAVGCGSNTAPTNGGGGSGGGGGTTSAFITLSATSLTFPTTSVGATSVAQVVTVTNTGTGSATASTYLVTGNSTDFTQTATTCGATLAAGASCTFTITFTPQASGSFSLTITASDSATNSPQTITLTGTGVSGPVPTATLTPATYTFPTTIVATTSAPEVFTLTNGGNGPLTIASIAVVGANPTDFAQTNTCGTSLAQSTSCTISVTFTPAVAFTTYTASVSVTDNAGAVTGSVQSSSFTGTSTTSTPTPLAVLTPTSLNFGSVTVVPGTIPPYTPPQVITLTNGGNATLTGIAISIGGTNPTSYSETTTCGTMLAAGSNCTISVTFYPITTGVLTATISVSDNATGAPQIATLTGVAISSTATVSYQLYVFGPPSATGGTNGGLLAPTPLYTLINGAKSTVDMTMYELQDTVFSGDLVADCARGVKVRVILSASEKSNDTPAYNQLNTAGTNCSAVFSNTAFTNTHQKTITVDNSTTAVLSLNLQTQYYSTTRDFAMVYNDPADIAAIEATFAQDYAAGTPYNGTQGPSDFSYQPAAGTDLIWSPTTATADMLALINNAKSTIVLENEEMSATNIVSALESACGRGVTVHIAMVNDSTSSPYSTYSTEFKALEAAGCGVRTYPDTTSGLYIHAKALVADYGLSTQSVYMGSINYSNASLTANRELGMYITDAASIITLYNSLTSDYAGATTF